MSSDLGLLSRRLFEFETNGFVLRKADKVYDINIISYGATFDENEVRQFLQIIFTLSKDSPMVVAASVGTFRAIMGVLLTPTSGARVEGRVNAFCRDIWMMNTAGRLNYIYCEWGLLDYQATGIGGWLPSVYAFPVTTDISKPLSQQEMERCLIAQS